MISSSDFSTEQVLQVREKKYSELMLKRAIKRADARQKQYPKEDRTPEQFGEFVEKYLDEEIEKATVGGF